MTSLVWRMETSKTPSILNVMGPDYAQALIPWPYPSLLQATFPVSSGKAETEEVLLLWLCELGQTHSLFRESGLLSCESSDFA